MKILKGILVCISLSLIIISCNDINYCQLVDDTNFIVFALFDRDTTSLTESADFSSVTMKGLDLRLIGFDLSQRSDTTLSVFALPINTLDSTATYYFESDLGLDTMVINYDSQYYIFFEDCDPAQSFFNLEVISHTFDSVSVVNSDLNDQIVRNVEVYLD